MLMYSKYSFLCFYEIFPLLVLSCLQIVIFNCREYRSDLLERNREYLIMRSLLYSFIFVNAITAINQVPAVHNSSFLIRQDKARFSVSKTETVFRFYMTENAVFTPFKRIE
jgi:hypothetical protein